MYEMLLVILRTLDLDGLSHLYVFSMFVTLLHGFHLSFGLLSFSNLGLNPPPSRFMSV
jgi:hypothetical protein